MTILVGQAPTPARDAHVPLYHLGELSLAGSDLGVG